MVKLPVSTNHDMNEIATCRFSFRVFTVVCRSFVCCCNHLIDLSSSGFEAGRNADKWDVFIVVQKWRRDYHNYGKRFRISARPSNGRPIAIIVMHKILARDSFGKNVGQLSLSLFLSL